MSNFWDHYGTDRDAENNGKWFDLAGGLKLKIARADTDANLKFAKHLSDLQRADYSDEAKAARAMIELYAGLVIDAKGIETREGAKIVYTQKAIIELFLELPELYKTVKTLANDYNNYRVKETAENLKK